MFKKENNKKIIVYILIGIVVVIGAIKLIDIYYQNNNNEEITIQNVLTTEDEPEKIENETIKVYVTGEVKNQGVIELEQGSRIVDQTCPIMIQRLNNIVQRNPLISIGI